MAPYRSFGGWTRPQQYASAPRLSHISAPGAASAPYAPAPVGGGDGGGVMPGYPMATAPRFQQSVDQERALNANKAATFAAAAPLPATDGASAYGNAQQSAAARAAFVSDQQARANINSGNFFQNTTLTHDANARANSESGAHVGAVDAWTQSYPGRVTAENNLNNSAAFVNMAKGAAIPGQAAAANGVAKSTAALNTARAGDVTAQTGPNAKLTEAKAGQATAAAGQPTADMATLKKQLADQEKRHKDELARLNHDLNYYRSQLGGQNRGAQSMGTDRKDLPSVVPPPYAPPPETTAPATGAAPQSAAPQPATGPAGWNPATGPSGDVFVNPKTGQRIRHDGDNWVPVG